MNTALSIIQGLLAAFFLMPAYKKLSTPKEKLIEMKQIKPGESTFRVRLLGLAELLGAIGIIVPYLTGILPILTSLAATGFGIVMVGAIIVHYRMNDFKVLPLLGLVFILSGYSGILPVLKRRHKPDK